jgi:O-methyltransferase
VAAAPSDYVELLKLSLLDLLGPATTRAVPKRRGSVRIETVPEAERDARMTGTDWPANGMTMIGWQRMTNLERCVEDVLANEVPGDLIETGVWRGGAAILMRALVKAHGGEAGRLVWLADSFDGLPEPNREEYPADAGDRHHKFRYLAATQAEVELNFSRYGLLDDGVKFLAGWFSETLPTLGDNAWSVLRLDGDMYESTLVALEHLYPQLSPGGYAIVDDYGAVAACRQAVHDYRQRNSIGEPIREVDWTGVYWQKAA